MIDNIVPLNEKILDTEKLFDELVQENPDDFVVWLLRGNRCIVNKQFDAFKQLLA